MKRSPEARARRRVQRQAVMARSAPRRVCVHCQLRPAVPLHSMCRACRYYTRGSR